MSPTRGPYARGRRSRDAVLDVALAVIAQKGYGAASLRAVADGAGMTPAGLLHHFGTRENLFTEVLRARDEADRAAFPDDPAARYPRLVRLARHNLTVPGLVRLHVALAAAAADPAHPAHEFFRERATRVHAAVAADVRNRQRAGSFAADVDATHFGRVLTASSDGLQAQWTVDPSIDPPGVLEQLWDRFALAGTPD
ncbi:TetR/AcrR family transcriptional regulator [Kineococcus esterisolvens]|uniref:TetR/AcrR family transcriptional regulator n=1 Tax=unclassified Kineococcus TaxID=2621656 RepID=UPI003D7EF7EC